MDILYNQCRTSRIRTSGLVVIFSVALSGVAFADVQSMAKALLPFEGMLTKGAIGLALLLVGLGAWEFIDNKRASRSSLDIAKLAAAAAKKKSSASAPASGSLDAQPASRSFAPPPPPPPPATESPSSSSFDSGSPPPPPPPPADNPFASSTPASSSSPFGDRAGESLGGVQPVESTVAFTPADAGSSGGWADLLQRVRAGEPEAASFSENSPAPSTESEAQAAAAAQLGASASPPSDLSQPSNAFAPPPVGGAPAEPSASSEAWEALLKRTTGTESSMDAPPSQDSGRISLGSGFAPPAPQSSPPPTDFGTPNAPAFSLPKPGASEPSSPPEGFGDPGGFQLPVSGGSDSPTSSFSLPGASASDSPTSSFSVPGATPPPPEPSGPPSFKLPGGGSSGAGGFQMPGQSPFGGGTDDSSSTMPLNDMFSPPPGGAPPSFQLPSAGGQPFAAGGGDSPFDFGSGDGAGRTISLDFSQGTGQIPPPPQPKTEG